MEHLIVTGSEIQLLQCLGEFEQQQNALKQKTKKTSRNLIPTDNSKQFNNLLNTDKWYILDLPLIISKEDEAHLLALKDSEN